jgi:hypothetical protein
MFDEQILPLLQSVAVWQLPVTHIPLTHTWSGPYVDRQALSLVHGAHALLMQS